MVRSIWPMNFEINRALDVHFRNFWKAGCRSAENQKTNDSTGKCYVKTLSLKTSCVLNEETLGNWQDRAHQCGGWFSWGDRSDRRHLHNNGMGGWSEFHDVIVKGSPKNTNKIKLQKIIGHLRNKEESKQHGDLFAQTNPRLCNAQLCSLVHKKALLWSPHKLRFCWWWYIPHGQYKYAGFISDPYSQPQQATHPK